MTATGLLSTENPRHEHMHPEDTPAHRFDASHSGVLTAGARKQVLKLMLNIYV